MIKIYVIEDINGLKYVGSTKEKYLNSRLSGHRYKKDCRASLLDLDNCSISLIELCEEKCRKEREQYWIDNIECVNYQDTFFNQDKVKIWRENYDDRRRILQRKRREYQRFIGEFLYLNPNLFL
jgi:hypothetical protein